MRLVVASCSARYSGRLNAHLPLATRLLVVKADGSVLLHSDGGSYKPLNWMSPPCTLAVEPSTRPGGRRHAVWTVSTRRRTTARDLDRRGPARLRARARGRPGAGQGRRRGPPAGAAGRRRSCCSATGYTLVRREYPTAIGPVDILAADPAGAHGRRRDQAPRRHRRRRAADPLPRAAQPRPAPGARARACSPRRRSSRRPACSPPTGASAAWCSTTTPCAASTTAVRGLRQPTDPGVLVSGRRRSRICLS